MARKKSIIDTPSLHTHETLGIPQSLQIAGKTIQIIFDPSIMRFKKREGELQPGQKSHETNGAWGLAQHIEQRILLFPGNEIMIPSKEKLRIVFLEEVTHLILHTMHMTAADMKEGSIFRDEHFVGLFSELWYQVLNQLDW